MSYKVFLFRWFLETFQTKLLPWHCTVPNLCSFLPVSTRRAIRSSAWTVVKLEWGFWCPNSQPRRADSHDSIKVSAQGVQQTERRHLIWLIYRYCLKNRTSLIPSQSGGLFGALSPACKISSLGFSDDAESEPFPPEAPDVAGMLTTPPRVIRKRELCIK